MVKKFLSVLMVLAIAAVNFTIPAMAATTITVDYKTGLPTGVYGTNTSYLQQGIWFYETSAGNSNVGSGLDTPSTVDRTYAPLEMPTTAVRAALNMRASEWIRYQVTATTAGYYSVVLNYNVSAAAGADVLVRTDDHIVGAHLDRTGTATTFKDSESLGYVYLTEGVNNLYVDNKSAAAQFNLRTIILTLDETNTVDATDVDILRPVASATEIGDYTIDYTDGYNQITVAGDLSFPLNIEADGKYQVSIMGKTTGEHTAVATIDDAVAEATVSNTAYEETTLGVFRLTEGEYNLSLSGLEDYNLAWVKVKYVGPYSTELVAESIETDVTVARGTDSYIAEYNGNISEVEEGQITLRADGTEIPVKAIVDEKTLTVAFLETLEDATTYTLTLNGVQGVFGEEAMEERVILFTTDDTMEPATLPTLEINEVLVQEYQVIIRGMVKGSSGEGIKGRTVSFEEFNTLSGDGGLFELVVTQSENAASGNYLWTITTEYGATGEVAFFFTNPNEATEALNRLSQTTQPDQVAAVFSEYQIALNLTEYASDIENFSEPDFFYQHFVGKEFANVYDDFLPFYRKMLLLEGLNQSTVADVVFIDYFNHEETMALFFPSDICARFSWVSASDRHTLAEQYVELVTAEGPCSQQTLLVERVRNLVDEYLGLSDSNLTCSTYYHALPVTMGDTSLVIPLQVEHPQAYVSEVTWHFTTSDPTLYYHMFHTYADYEIYDGYAEFYDPLNPQYLSVKGKQATLTLSMAESAFSSEFGCLVVELTTAKNISLTISAEVTHRFSATEFETTNVLPKEITIDTLSPVEGDGWSITADGVLTLSGYDLGYASDNGSMGGNPPFNRYKRSIKKIILVEGYQKIGDMAFYYYPALQEVVLPSTLREIGWYAFGECSNLKKIVLPEGLKKIYSNAFNFCSGLEEIVIPDSVTYLSTYAFANCTNLKSATVGSGVRFSEEDESISGIFIGCSNLEKVILRPGVNRISDRMFAACQALKEIEIPDTVTSIGDSAFLYCTSLENINLPDSVTTIGSSTFRNCYSLKHISLPDSLETIGLSAFENCYSLENIILPDSVTTIGGSAFAHCENLTEIALPRGVTQVGTYAFTGCLNLKTVSLGEQITRISDGAFSGCKNLTEITIPDSVEYVGYQAFEGCESLTSVSIPKNLTVIDDRAFASCSGLTDVYYNGTPDEWNEVYIGADNDALKQANVHFVYHLSYDANGGKNAPETVNIGENVNIGEIVNLSEQIPTRFGYNFLGWAKSPDAFAAEYQPGDFVEFTGENIRLYAVWSQMKLKVFRYVSEDGQGEILTVETVGISPEDKVIAAFYQGGVLQSTQLLNQNGETRNFLFVAEGSCDMVKVFAFSGEDGCTPLVNAEEIKGL